jgi:hypothetical protein
MRADTGSTGSSSGSTSGGQTGGSSGAGLDAGPTSPISSSDAGGDSSGNGDTGFGPPSASGCTCFTADIGAKPSAWPWLGLGCAALAGASWRRRRGSAR